MQIGAVSVVEQRCACTGLRLALRSGETQIDVDDMTLAKLCSVPRLSLSYRLGLASFRGCAIPKLPRPEYRRNTGKLVLMGIGAEALVVPWKGGHFSLMMPLLGCNVVVDNRERGCFERLNLTSGFHVNGLPCTRPDIEHPGTRLAETIHTVQYSIAKQVNRPVDGSATQQGRLAKISARILIRGKRSGAPATAGTPKRSRSAFEFWKKASGISSAAPE